ncbi:PH domain-containing protein [Streptomyces sp. NPDC089919]|uniref:PH domain-containing protein n=1 Tax=Streptomyces sp. NPDC089919 TaxID=3155188 RepID=UPI00342492F4
MPLPFLTADSAFDAHDQPGPDDTPLPYEDHDRWRRPYRPGPWRVAGGALLLLLASFMLFAAVIVGAAGAAGGALGCLAAGLLVVGAALRLLRTGIWVSRAGLRRVSFFFTRTIGWQEVAEVRTVQQPVRWLGLPRTVQGQALTASARSGGALPVLLTDHNADFLARTEAFDRAADTVEAWAAEYAPAAV